jgi:hypothetical protein
MNRPMKRYVEKFEALDFAAGTYNARTLKRERYNQRDFLEYLSAYELIENEPVFTEELME